MSVSTTFLRRARLEAERYGADPWVFVREFTQNARDAGATCVDIRVTPTAQGTSLIFVDDGQGMSWDHAQRFLFSLYSSSKSEDLRTVGKFGVGFWSHLRIDPIAIDVRSRLRGKSGWSLRIDAARTTARRGDYEGPVGTQIELHLSLASAVVREAVEDAARQSVRFIRTLRGDEPLRVSIQGDPINASFSLPSPSRQFVDSGVRGVVALGRSPRVELFSRGIRVRAAGCLHDLLRDHPKLSYSRLRFSSLPGSLAPQVLLEVDDLDLDLSRSDVKNAATVTRAVQLARRHLERLVIEQLDALAPPGLLDRLRARVGGLFTMGILSRRRVVSGVFTLTVCVAGVSIFSGRTTAPAPSRVSPSGVSANAPRATSPVSSAPSPYKDLRESYRGPSSHPAGLAASFRPIDLRHTPNDRSLYLAMMRIADDPLGAPNFTTPTQSPAAVTCERGCITIALRVHAASGFLPLPIPTGMGVVPGSIRVQEARLDAPVLADAAGMPMVMFARETQGIMTYSVGALLPQADQEIPHSAQSMASDALPPGLLAVVERARARPHNARVRMLLDEVRARVRYDLSPEVDDQHRALEQSGVDPLTRLLRVGAGDCDLQNGLLTMLSHAAGVPARMAVGYLTQNGQPRPFLHAWVEWRDEAGTWRVADASDSQTMAATPITDPALESATAYARAEPASARTPPTTTSMRASSEVIGRPSPLQPSPSSSPTAPSPKRRDLALTLVVIVLGAGFALAISRRRQVVATDPPEILQFVRGLLSRPQILHDLPILATRPLIRTMTGRRLSISRCRGLAAAGRLFIASDDTPIALTGTRMRGEILDANHATSRLVATMMDAHDLDRWHNIMETGVVTPLLRRVERQLELMTPCKLLVVNGAAVGVTAADLRPLRAATTSRVHVAIDSEHPTYQRALALHSSHPSLALAILIELVLRAFPNDPRDAREITKKAARSALYELVEVVST